MMVYMLMVNLLNNIMPYKLKASGFHLFVDCLRKMVLDLSGQETSSSGFMLMSEKCLT